MHTRKLSLALVGLMLISSLIPIFETDQSSSLDTQNNTLQSSSIACLGDICLNEALPNPNGNDNAAWPGGEWVEIYNNGSMSIDVSGWYIENKVQKQMIFNSTTIVDYDSTNPSSWTIAPGDYMVIARNAMPNSMFYLSNSNDIITLFDSVGNQLDVASWSFSSSGAPSGTSLQEDPINPTNDWVATNNTTPGGDNDGAATGGPTLVTTDLKINEVMSNPWPSEDSDVWPGGEWVEILNTGSEVIDLTGWYIEDAAGNQIMMDETHLIDSDSAIPESFHIAGGHTRIIAVNGSSNSGLLNNGVEQLLLKLPNGSITHVVDWTDTVNGYSLSYDSSTQSMFYSSYPSLNQTNPLPIEQLSPSPADVRFTEVMPHSYTNGTSYPDGEWIEIHNTGATTVDLLGWTITDGMGNVTTLDPVSLVFNNSQGSTDISPDGRRLVQFTGETRLWDYYNHLILMDTSGSINDVAWYSNDYGMNTSLIRNSNPSNAWMPSSWITPGQPEPGTGPVSSSDIIFTEIMPNPTDADTQSWPLGEWIELYNNDSTVADISGWKLKANNRNFVIDAFNLPLQSDTLIQPGDVAIIALNGTSSFYLKQSSDIITIVDSMDSIVDVAGWNETNENQSLVAPSTSHSGYATQTASGLTGWVQSAWQTPGEVNPDWPQYTDSNNLEITEFMASCSSNSEFDWIEFYNNDSAPINLSRWRIDSSLGSREFINTMATLGDITSDLSGPDNASTILNSGEYAIVKFANSLLMNDHNITLYNPDGVMITQFSIGINTLCKSKISSSNGWVDAPWSTPAQANPDSTSLATAGDVIFTRLMTEGSNDDVSNSEFIEIRNIDDSVAYLNGWTFDVTAGGTTNTYTVNQLIIPASSSVVLANDAVGIWVTESSPIILDNIEYLSFNDVFGENLLIPDSGAAIQMKDASGIISDSIVYDNGPSESDGWSGQSITPPRDGINMIVYVRGDGCSYLPDTDTAIDWNYRWSVLGASNFCSTTQFNGTSTITPLIGPQDGLLDLLNWIEGATTSLEVHIYQMQEPRLVQALMNAASNGVEVKVLLDEGCTCTNIWSYNDMQLQYGFASELDNAGAEVFWFGGNSDQPYLYIHSKVAVRDGNSVWMSSGNWKSSSQPAPGVRGNVEWSIIVDNQQLADIVLQQMDFDTNTQLEHITAYSSSDEPSDWTMPGVQSISGGGLATSYSVDTSGEVLTCPNNCITGISNMIDSAMYEVVLSQQTLDVDWYWGWGQESPVIQSLYQAANRGVAVRVIINGAYLDDDDQDIIDLLNEQWNGTEGLDASAIVMSEDDDVSKLHNKGIIVDEKSVLVSSINLGSSAMNRNREMGVIIHSEIIAQIYKDAWNVDWNRLDNVTDTDQDGLVDKWEVPNGLNRTKRVLDSGVTEDLYDADGDGLSNIIEYNQGSHPLLADTDGDCIRDDVEIAWAQSTALDPNVVTVSPYDALNLADADGDGVNESTALGCDLGGIETDNGNSTDNQTLDPVGDEDSDGIVNEFDICPGTPEGTPTDTEGCSNKQRMDLADASTGEEDNSGTNTMLWVMLLAGILAVGAFVILKQLESKAEAEKDLVSIEEQERMLAESSGNAPEEQSWDMPVLDGSDSSPSEDISTPGISQEDLAKCPGWDEATIQSYLDQGWTIDQLAEYYAEQLE